MSAGIGSDIISGLEGLAGVGATLVGGGAAGIPLAIQGFGGLANNLLGNTGTMAQTPSGGTAPLGFNVGSSLGGGSSGVSDAINAASTMAPALAKITSGLGLNIGQRPTGATPSPAATPYQLPPAKGTPLQVAQAPGPGPQAAGAMTGSGAGSMPRSAGGAGGNQNLMQILAMLQGGSSPYG